MLMYHKVRITADQGPVPVITLGSMLVNPQGVQIAVQHFFGDRSLGIACPGMGMFRNFTGGSFQRDGRQDQGVGGAKDHHRRQTGDNPIPPLFALVLAGILCRLLLVLLHFRHRPFCIGTGIPKRPRTAQTFFVVVEFVPPRQGGWPRNFFTGPALCGVCRNEIILSAFPPGSGKWMRPAKTFHFPIATIRPSSGARASGLQEGGKPKYLFCHTRNPLSFRLFPVRLHAP